MVELPDSIDELAELLKSDDTALVAKALGQITKEKGRTATRILTEYLKTAPVGLLATRAAIALENRKHKSCLPALYEIYQKRPELAEDIVPIFSAMEDEDGLILLIDDLDKLLSGGARLSTLAYLIKCADPEAVADILLPKFVFNTIPGASDDLRWALEQILSDANDTLLAHIKETATTLGPEALEFVQPFLPAESELERQAPSIARAFLMELVRIELVELVPDSEDALIDTISNAILEARSPKGLIRDVERILLNSTSIDEVYADRDDLKKAFAKVTSG